MNDEFTYDWGDSRTIDYQPEFRANMLYDTGPPEADQPVIVID